MGENVERWWFTMVWLASLEIQLYIKEIVVHLSWNFNFLALDNNKNKIIKINIKL